ncbi:MAG: FAD-binding and (Fe-S)-binding domain-containing protein [Nocardioides sp.]
MSTPAEAVLAELGRAGVTDADGSTLARALYSTDASLYRVQPLVVVRPRDTNEVLATLDVARRTGTPLTMRGAGTSIAGNAVGPGIVVDTSKHLNRVLSVDPEAGTADVQPGVVHAALQRAATPYGLRFGPDPSTHTRCTIGGMIGNNACGSRALGYGRTSDNVVALDAVTGAGERLRTGESGGAAATGLAALVDTHLATVRTELGRFGRQVSGYSLEHLLPEHGRNLGRFLVGSEGTLTVVLGATVRLVGDPPARALAVLGYPSMFEAADAVPGLLHHPLVACEGLDSRIVDVVRARRGVVPDLPRGAGWLFAEVAGATEAEVVAAARAVIADARALDSRVVVAPAEAAALWRIREDGAGLAAVSLNRPAHSGWEDAAVPPDRLGGYLRDFDALLRDYDYDGVPYGHFGDGCVHVRIDFELRAQQGRARFREFLGDAARLVASYGGTLSGEHGDGRARSELLPLMYSAGVIDLFGRVKALLDPDDLLNPGVLVAPRPVDADLRLAAPMREPATELRWVHDGGSVVDAVHRCTGVGKCLAAPAGSVMCPSYQATREEKDSTRGRARVLQEMVNGTLVTDGWRSVEVHEALDLCLSCKGCASDCPTGVDMATYKSEALHQRYQGRVRPRSHYALGRLPRWLRMSGRVGGLAAPVLGRPALQRVARAVAGVDQRRSIPLPARESLRAWARRTSYVRRATALETYDLPDVVVWADTFTDHFTPGNGQAAVELLERAGLRVGVVGESACCALTWVSTGQLDAARKILGRTVGTLHAYAVAGIPVLALEPSCLATLRSDAAELLDDPRVAEVARNTVTLAELLTGLDGWTPPDLTGTEIVVQPHCHHAGVLGWETDARLLGRTGATVTRVDGCCGLAGNFGVERGRYDVSVAVAETHLLPAVRAADPGAVVLADGFSCRTQLDDLARVGSVHLAELLNAAARPDREG